MNDGGLGFLYSHCLYSSFNSKPYSRKINSLHANRMECYIMTLFWLVLFCFNLADKLAKIGVLKRMKCAWHDHNLQICEDNIWVVIKVTAVGTMRFPNIIYSFVVIMMCYRVKRVPLRERNYTKYYSDGSRIDRDYTNLYPILILILILILNNFISIFYFRYWLR
jgi:hypothetical protein